MSAWRQAGLETGIYVSVEIEYFNMNYPYVERIFFKFLDQEAEDESILRRMLKMKAFL